MSTELERNTKPAQVRYTKVRYMPRGYGEKETMRVDSGDLSTLSEQPIDAVEMLKSIHDHETSTCTCLRAEIFGPKAAAAPWSLGERMFGDGRIGDWLGLIANRNGHTFRKSVLFGRKLRDASSLPSAVKGPKL